MLSLLIAILRTLNRSEYKGKLFANTYITSHSGSFDRPPFYYENNKILSVTIETSRSILKSLVPSYLNLNKENRIIFYIGDLNIVRPYRLNYKEGGILIPVTYKYKKSKKSAFYVPVLFLDEIDPMINGREIYGFNKHFANIDIERKDESVIGLISINSKEILNIKFDIDEINSDINENIKHGGYIMTKRIPSCEYDNCFDVHKLNLCKVKDVFITEKIIGQAEVILGNDESFSIDKIKINKVLNASYNTGKSILESGYTIYDYLS